MPFLQLAEHILQQAVSAGVGCKSPTGWSYGIAVLRFWLCKFALRPTAGSDLLGPDLRCYHAELRVTGATGEGMWNLSREQGDSWQAATVAVGSPSFAFNYRMPRATTLWQNQFPF